MAFQAKKLSVVKIRNIFVSGKALREEVVLERVYGKLAGASKVYLDSCNSEFEPIKCCSSLSTSVIKRCVRDLLIYLVKRLSSLEGCPIYSIRNGSSNRLRSVTGRDGSSLCVIS